MNDSTPSQCPFSVGVIVSAAQGKPAMHTKNDNALCGSSLVDQIDGSRPAALVPVGSNSDSDDSDPEDDDPITSLTVASTSNSSRKKWMDNAAVTSEEAGVVDCLSDQFSQLFCGAEHSFCSPRDPDSKNDSPRSSCTDFQMFFNPSSSTSKSKCGGYSPFKFWCSPSTSQLTINETPILPQNRSSCRKRRSSYISTIWNRWHEGHSAALPLKRSRSVPHPEDNTPPAIPTSSDSRDLCYDSDPEQEHWERQARYRILTESQPAGRNFRKRRPRTLRTMFGAPMMEEAGPPPPPAPRNDYQRPSFDFDRPAGYRTPQHAHQTRLGFFDSPRTPMHVDMMNPNAEEQLRDKIQEITNTRIQLVWHMAKDMAAADPIAAAASGSPSPSGRQFHPAPFSIHADFEVGAHLDELVVQPKFTWAPNYEEKICKGKKELCLNRTEPHSIELLSIIRVGIPQQQERPLLNRQDYPFCRLDRTLCITTNDEFYPYLVFEARSPMERDWLATSLKMIVARLASIIIVRDEVMLMEFFTPYAALMNLDDDEDDDEDDDDEEATITCPSKRAGHSSSQRSMETVALDDSTDKDEKEEEGAVVLTGNCKDIPKLGYHADPPSFADRGNLFAFPEDEQ